MLSKCENGASSINDTWIGIDFGNSATRVAYFNGKTVQILPDENGNTSFPSTVVYQTSSYKIGLLPHTADLENGPYDSVSYDFKPRQNCYRDYLDETKKLETKRWSPTMSSKSTDIPYTLSIFDRSLEKTKESFRFAVRTMFMKAKEIAETNLQKKLENAVVTCPEHFTYADRTHLIQAAQEAGFEEVRLINDTMAAAIYYAHSRRILECRNLLVVNVGRSSMAASVIDIHGSTFTTSPQARLRAPEKSCSGFDLYPFGRLFFHAEELKKALTQRTSITARMTHRNPHFTQERVVTRAEFNDMTRETYKGIDKCVERTIAQGVSSAAMLQNVMLVGGNTFVQKVQKTIEGQTKIPALRNINVLESCALGAALYASSFSETSAIPHLRIHELIRRTFYLRNESHRYKPEFDMIPRGEHCPADAYIELENVYGSVVVLKLFEHGDDKDYLAKITLQNHDISRSPIYLTLDYSMERSLIITIRHRPNGRCMHTIEIIEEKSVENLTCDETMDIESE
ncbi:hypothetical protein L596_006152 [Steinernema carpocapsae]|uniref:Uncharacterized protein n=1 Tax=Steinernema carpocapsae TaxID=34508 RepID=A0A4U8V2M0_STECR|nr:hypothetical protein L596_006152 [Steinernema carpocapsae]